mmetsp:Transcript_48424/g.96909  ORF Transcript_48424/g.96909 Transcript_48424/m.96909 type:complete len:151 (+) Transcript_48424:482-934(+)
MDSVCWNLPPINVSLPHQGATLEETALGFRVFSHLENALTFSSLRAPKIALHFESVEEQTMKLAEFLGVEAVTIPPPPIAVVDDRKLEEEDYEIAHQLALGYDDAMLELVGFPTLRAHADSTSEANHVLQAHRSQPTTCPASLVKNKTKH